MKVYQLTIIYDENGDEIDYIEETLDDHDDSNLARIARLSGLNKEETKGLLNGSIEDAEA